MIMKTLTLAMIVLLACTTSQISNATSSIEESRQRVVTLTDLDLSHLPDIQKLHRRIATAAREVCWTPGVIAILSRHRMQRCAEESIAHAIAELDVPQLTRYHERELSREL
jgi:UrcA family protein